MDNVRVYERIEIRADHYHAPWRRYRSLERRRLGEALGFLFWISEFIGMADRKGMAEHGAKSIPAVSTQTHPGIIYQRRFGDRGVARAVRQPDGDRWSRPLTTFYFSNFFPVVHTFIVAVKVVEPRGAAFREHEGRRLVRYSCPAVTGNDVTE